MHCATPSQLRPTATCQQLQRYGARPVVRSVSTSVSRRDLLASIAGVTSLLLLKQADAAAADPPSSSSSGTSSTSSGSSISIMPINSAAKEYMDARDEAMDYKCKGGMFDCDGDRTEFAKKQYADWLAAGGVPKRIREGRADGPRSY